MSRDRKPRRGFGRDIEFPFLVHQVLDYFAALYLLQVGAQLGGRAAPVCYVAGAAMLIGATFSGRPLGGGPLTRPMHRLVDLALIAGVAAAPFVFGFTDRTSALIRLEGLALALLALVKCTNYGYAQPGMARDIARGLRAQAPRSAGRFVGRRVAAKRRPPGPSA
jgi:hypothetical protein